MEPCLLNELQLDAIREICNIGMGHATTALSHLLNTRIEAGMPSVHLLALGQVHEFIGGAEQPVVGIMFRMTGDADGLLALIFPHDCALRLISHLTSSTVTAGHALSEFEASAIMEIGNILASAHLNAISKLLNLTLLPSIPSLLLDMAGAVLDPILTRQCSDGDISLFAQAEFNAVGSGIAGMFFMIPDPDSLQLILQASGTLDA